MTFGSADRAAIARVFDVVPTLRRVASAGEALALGDRELLHAGPPISDPTRLCAPVLHSAITAALFEGWARSIDEARTLLRSGVIRLRAAQDAGCAVPLADVVSRSMRLQEVCDRRAQGRSAWSPLNGGNAHPLRVGMLGADVLDQLRWVNGPFADALAQAVQVEPIDVLPLADAGLAGGDDCHGRTGVATVALGAVLDRRWRASDAAACREFFAAAPGIFLNVWMAASKCMLDAANDIAGASLVTGAGGNGIEFGIRLASSPKVWHTSNATPPAMAMALPVGVAALGAIGDSALVDILGLGAMTTLAQGDGTPPFAPVFADAVGLPKRLLAQAHAGFVRTRPLLGLCATRVVDVGAPPLVSLGVLDREGVQGRVAGGFYRPPLELFGRAVSALAQ